MPGMDGFETARLVRSRARNRATPIIFITGLSWQDDEILRGYELGAFDFLIKPIRAEVLRAKASVFIQLQERTIELQRQGRGAAHEAQMRAHERELAMQRKRFEAEVLEHQMQQLAETDRRKDEFLAILAHELRNPLQPLQTAVELIEHDADEAGAAARAQHHPASGPRHRPARRRPARRRAVPDRQARAAARAGRRSTRSSTRRSSRVRAGGGGAAHTIVRVDRRRRARRRCSAIRCGSSR